MSASTESATPMTSDEEIIASIGAYGYGWHDPDDAGATVVVAALPAPAGLGVAIEDRLRKAAAAHE